MRCIQWEFSLRYRKLTHPRWVTLADGLTVLLLRFHYCVCFIVVCIDNNVLIVWWCGSHSVTLGYRGGSPATVRPSDPALCGSCPLVTPYYCRLGDLLCFVFILWYYWLGLLTCKNRLPYNLYCVGGDVKHCSIQSNHSVLVLGSMTICGCVNHVGHLGNPAFYPPWHGKMSISLQAE